MQYLLNKFLWGGFAALFFASCSPPLKSKKAIIENASTNSDIEINLEFVPAAKHIGTTNIDGKEFIYFANFKTNNAISLYSDLDSLFLTIELDTLRSIPETIDDIWFYSLDTIILNTSYTNKLFFFNSKGELWKKVNLNNQLKDDSSHYELWSAFCNEMYHIPPIYTAENRLDKYSSSEDQIPSLFERIKRFDFNSSRKSLILQLDNIFSDKPKLKHSELSYHRINPEYDRMATIPFNYAAHKEDFTYFAFSHSPYIYKLNANLKIVDSILISHPNTTTSVDPVSYDKTTYKTLGPKLDSLIDKGGFIGGLSTYKKYLIAGIITETDFNKMAIIDLKNTSNITWINLQKDNTVVIIPFKNKLYVKKRDTPENLKNKSVSFSVYDLP